MRCLIIHSLFSNLNLWNNSSASSLEGNKKLNASSIYHQNPGPWTYLGKFGDTAIRDFKRLGKIGTEDRFTTSNPYYKRTISPGPATYDRFIQ